MFVILVLSLFNSILIYRPSVQLRSFVVRVVLVILPSGYLWSHSLRNTWIELGTHPKIIKFIPDSCEVTVVLMSGIRVHCVSI